MKSGYPSQIGKGSKGRLTALSGESGQDQRLFGSHSLSPETQNFAYLFEN
jgi:hypothetical protein